MVSKEKPPQGDTLFALSIKALLKVLIAGTDTIAKIEGGRRWVGDSELIELARALGRPLVELFPARVQAVVRGR